jgi:hypothetical protein
MHSGVDLPDCPAPSRPFLPFVVRDGQGKERGRFETLEPALRLFLAMAADGGKQLIDERIGA